MFNLFRAEMIKILGKKSTKISIIIAFIFMALSCFFQASSEVSNENWKDALQKEIDFAKNEIEEHKGTDSEEFYEELYRADIVIGEYSLENNIANNVVTPIKFTYNNTFCLSVWIVLLVVLATINFSDEYQFGTIKQILTRPYKRRKILFVKQIFFSGLSILVLFVQIIMSYIVGCFFFGENDAADITIEYMNGKIIEIDMRSAMWQTYFSYVVLIVLLISIAFLCVVIIRTTIIPVLMTLTIWLCSSLIVEILSKYEIVRYTIFPHLDLTQYIVGNDLVLKGNTISISLSVLLITYIVIQIITYKLFEKRDV